MAKVSKEERLKNVQAEREKFYKLREEACKASDDYYELASKADRKIEQVDTHLSKLLAMEVKDGTVLEGTRWTIRSNCPGILITRAAANTPFKDYLRKHKDALEYGSVELGKFKGCGIFIKVNTDWNNKITSFVFDSYGHDLEDIELAKWLTDRGAIVTNSDGKKRIQQLKEKISELKEEVEELEKVENLVPA